MSNSYKLLIAQYVNENDESNAAVHEERLQYQDIVTNELKTKLNALGGQETAERAVNSRLALAMQQDFECGAFSSTCGDVETVNSSIDSGITGDD